MPPTSLLYYYYEGKFELLWDSIYRALHSKVKRRAWPSDTHSPHSPRVLSLEGGVWDCDACAIPALVVMSLLYPAWCPVVSHDQIARLPKPWSAEHYPPPNVEATHTKYLGGFRVTWTNATVHC